MDHELTEVDKINNTKVRIVVYEKYGNFLIEHQGWRLDEFILIINTDE